MTANDPGPAQHAWRTLLDTLRHADERAVRRIEHEHVDAQADGQHEHG